MIIDSTNRWLAGLRPKSRAELFAAFLRRVYQAWLDPSVPDNLAKLAHQIGQDAGG
jgi:hypothetical protein